MPSSIEFVKTIAKSIVRHPEKVETRWVDSPKEGYIELKVSPEDNGIMIGRKGRTIQALRVLTTTVFGNDEQDTGIKLVG